MVFLLDWSDGCEEVLAVLPINVGKPGDLYNRPSSARTFKTLGLQILGRLTSIAAGRRADGAHTIAKTYVTPVHPGDKSLYNYDKENLPMPCRHLRELYEICNNHKLKLSSSDLIRIVCPACGVAEECPSVLFEEYENQHPDPCEDVKSPDDKAP